MTVFEREVVPIMQQQQQLWPADVQTYEAFELYAGLVQSRAFHMLSENWLTGLAQEGPPVFSTSPFFINQPLLQHRALAFPYLAQSLSLASLWIALLNSCCM